MKFEGPAGTENYTDFPVTFPHFFFQEINYKNFMIASTMNFESLLLLPSGYKLQNYFKKQPKKYFSQKNIGRNLNITTAKNDSKFTIIAKL